MDQHTTAQAAETDVHTEHCCSKHGCKYASSACTVTSGKRKQSFPCEACLMEEAEGDDTDEE